MKKICFWIIFATLPLAANAQPGYYEHNIVSFSIGGPTTKICVIDGSGSTNNFLVEIGNHGREVLGNGAEKCRSYGYGNEGQVAIIVYACATTNIQNDFIPPPLWASDPTILGPVAITREYLATDPNEPMLKQRIKNIERVLDKQLGKKQRMAELNDWFKTVKRNGLRTDRATCTDPQILVQQVYANNFFYGNHKVVLVVRYTGKRGYVLDRR